jgi:hypothetical protein
MILRDWGPARVEPYVDGFDVSANLSANEQGALTPHCPVAVVYPSGYASPAEKLGAFANSGVRRMPLTQLDESLAARLRDAMPAIAGHFSFRHYARFDFRYSASSGKLYFLEANLCPNFEPEDNFAVGANWTGIDYSEIFRRIFSTACRDGGLS